MADQSADDIQALLSRVHDEEILRHGFAAHLRDYELLVAMHDLREEPIAEQRERWVFSHCVLAETHTAHSAQNWVRSWEDALTGPQFEEAWHRLGGYVWVEYAVAYPGPSYVTDSPEAARWSRELGHQMHEVRIETNVYNLRLIFHRLSCEPVDPQ
jgi:hypothetical protein